MNWQKKGLIFNTNKELEWSQSHAQVPVVDKVSEEMWRIYYATRNQDGKSNISYIEVEAGNPENILYQHHQSILDFGAPGTFDDSGLMPTCIVNHGTQKYLYYIGWMLRGTTPYQNSVGLAISNDGGRSFQKAFPGPVLGMSKKEPYFVGTAYMLLENNEYRAYYLSCVGWKLISGKYEPFYNIKMATSDNGIDWNITQEVAIELRENEGGIASASVIKIGTVYHMWFSVRQAEGYRVNKNAAYTIGYARSSDGWNWERNDELAGIEKSELGWDSHMIAYPYVIQHKSKLFMFYNGNGFGQTGFGYAVQEVSPKGLFEKSSNI